MKTGSKPQVYAVYALVLAAGIALTALVNFQGNASRISARALTDADLPTLQRLSDLKADVIAVEPIVYRYYLLGERDRFAQELAANEARIDQALRQIDQSLVGHPVVAAVRDDLEAIRARIASFDASLRAGEDVPGTAIEALARISDLCAGVNVRVESLRREVQAVAGARSADIGDRSLRIVAIVAAFSGLLFVVTLVAGYYARAYLAEAASRRRLSMFPERNPNPVLRLNALGDIDYANPGAMRMAEDLLGSAQQVAKLLPPGLDQKLMHMAEISDAFGHWEYGIAERTLDCGIHWLPDDRVFHVYLADVTARKQAEEQLVHQAYHDALTGLPNRRLLGERLRDALRRTDDPSSLMLLHPDRMQQVIEGLGHDAGDRLLAAFAHRLRDVVDACRGDGGDIGLFRFEGERFAILVSRLPNRDTPTQLASRVANALETPLDVDGRRLFLSASIGISVAPQDGIDGDTLVRNAESALFHAQRAEGNAFRCYAQAMNSRALERLELEQELRLALRHHQLELHYQPQVDLTSGQLTGAEALLRWRHPLRGMMPPGEFIPLAEDTGLIVPIGEWVLQEACRQVRRWRERGHTSMRVAVNLSARQFRQGNLEDMVRETLADAGLPGHAIELEVTESVAMQEVESTVATLEALHGLGIRLSIDDFGTGYSSLSYLKRFPLDKLKIDQSFVRQLRADSLDAAIVQAIIALGQGLGLRVIAEGVESDAQRALLTTYGCDEIQGYLIGRPVPAPEFQRHFDADGGASAILQRRIVAQSL